MSMRKGYEDKIDLYEEKRDKLKKKEIEDVEKVEKVEEINEEEKSSLVANIIHDYNNSIETLDYLIEVRKKLIEALMVEFEDTPSVRIAYALKELLKDGEKAPQAIMKNMKNLAKINSELTGKTDSGGSVYIENAIISGNIDDIIRLKKADVEKLKEKN